MTSASGERPFVIAGGGIGGIATALALARAGFAVRVLEQSASVREVGAGIHRYAEARYPRTAKVQITARIYGEFYHARGVTAGLRNPMLGARTPEVAYDGMEWLYGPDAAV